MTCDRNGSRDRDCDRNGSCDRDCDRIGCACKAAGRRGVGPLFGVRGASADPSAVQDRALLSDPRRDRDSALSGRDATLFGRYRVVSHLGHGGSSEVWLAHDLELDRDVAVKVLHPDLVSDSASRARFLEEARTAAALSHPSIVAVHDVHVNGPLAALVLEHVDGETLAARLARDGALPAGEAAWIAGEIADALRHAHARGVVHRDVKPGNILLGRDGHARLADFGIARMSLDRGVSAGIPGVEGTLRYMAPEQLAGAPPGPAADVFSLGAVLHEMLTGEAPFDAATPWELAPRQAAGPVAAERLPHALAPLVFACLDPDPRRRPPAAVVARWAHGQIAGTKVVAPVRRAAGGAHWRIAVGGLLVAGILGVSAALASTAQGPGSPPAGAAAASVPPPAVLATPPAASPRGGSGAATGTRPLTTPPAAAPGDGPIVPAVQKSTPGTRHQPAGHAPGHGRGGRGHGEDGAQQGQEGSDG